MSLKVTAIFDIGKTNKKFFLFDEQLNQVYQEYIQFPEIKDDDGFDCDDLPAIEKWTMDTYNAIIKDERFEIEAINFSAYGATMVYLDEFLRPFTPLYNYTKPFPAYLLEPFKKKYGNLETWSQQTASPVLGMLNAGLQLFWFKYEKPQLYSKLRYAVFLPQYLSFLFSKKLMSEYTGIGCHTGMHAGFALISATARLNSSTTPCAGSEPNCGSMGPKLDCLPMTISLQAQLIIVPADIAN